MLSQLTNNAEYQAFVKFLDLSLEVRQLRARLAELVPQLKALQPALLGYLGAAGIKSLPVADYQLYSHREPWVYPAKGISRQQICVALKQAGLGKMVQENYSTQALTSYVKDLEQHHRLIVGLSGTLDKLLPAPLAASLAVVPDFSIRVRKNPSNKGRPAYAEDRENYFTEEGSELNEQP